MLFVFLERYKTRQFLDCAGHGRQGLPNFMRDGGGKTAQGGHAFLGRDFLLQPAKIRQVLEIKNVAVAFGIVRSHRRDTDAEIADIPGRRKEINLISEREPLGILIATGQPETFIKFLQFLAAHFSKAMPENLLAGAIQQQDTSGQVRGDQTAAHGMNNIFGKVLESEEFLTLLFELQAFLTKRLGQETGQISHCKKPQKIHDQPDAKGLRGWQAGKGARNSLRESQYRHAREKQKTGRRD